MEIESCCPSVSEKRQDRDDGSTYCVKKTNMHSDVESAPSEPRCSPPATPVNTPTASPAKSCQENPTPTSVAISSHRRHESSAPTSNKSQVAAFETELNMDYSQSDKEENNDGPQVDKQIAEIFGENDDDEEFVQSTHEESVCAKLKKGTISEEIPSPEAKCEDDDLTGIKKILMKVDGDHGDDKTPALEETSTSVQKRRKSTRGQSDNPDDEGVRHSEEEFVSDFDLMIQRKREENRRKRKRKYADLINENDDMIADLIQNMKHASEEDKELNKQKKPATKKVKILPVALSQLRKQDLKEAFLEHGILSVFADWLSPLPDRGLPHLSIREGIIRILAEFSPIHPRVLNSSGVGRVIMFLYKHPKEAKENKEKIGRIIVEWSRVIFNVTDNPDSLSKEQRERRVSDHIPNKRIGKEPAEEQDTVGAMAKTFDEALNDTKTSPRAGDRGLNDRAQAHMPSTKDYVVRPKSNVDLDIGTGRRKKSINRFERMMKSVQHKKRRSRNQTSESVSLDGRNMRI